MLQVGEKEMKPVVIIVHEVRGITENLRLLASLLESEGYCVILPSLYGENYAGSDEQTSYDRFFRDVGIEKATEMIGEIITANDGAGITLLGFSVGATIAWRHSRNGKVRSVVGFYGSRIRHFQEVEPLADVDLFFSIERGFNAEELVGRLNGKQNVAARLISGDHGFYSKLDFDSPEIRETNRMILALLKGV